MPMTVEGYLSHGLCHRDGDAGKCAWLDLTIKFVLCDLREPIDFELFGISELIHESGVGFGDALLLLVDEALAKGEEDPVAIGDEDVVEEPAEFRIVEGGWVLFDGTEEVRVGPPFVADELIDEAKHGRNVAGPSRSFRLHSSGLVAGS